MRGLHRGFELIAADRRRYGSRAAATPRLRRSARASHSARVLLGERHVVAIRAAPRAAPRFRVQHQREQSERLGLVGQQRDDQPAEPDRLLGEIAPARFGARPGRSSLRRTPRRSPPARRRAARGCRRAPARGTERRPARIFCFARERRCPIVAGATRNADAMVAASKPRIVCRISGARMPASIAGCAQANISARRSSGISPALVVVMSSSSAIRRMWLSPRVGGARAPRRVDRARGARPPSARLRDCPECRSRGQSASAAANASDSASSAPATSRVRADEVGDQLAVAAARDASAVIARRSSGLAH